MKKDLDRLMEERGLDAAVVSGNVYGNPTMSYLLNGAAVGGGIIVKKRGQKPTFIHYSIEREEAVASGLELVDLSRYDYMSILREKPDRLAANVELYRRIFADLGVKGEVGFYGMADQGSAFVFLSALGGTLSDVHVHGEYGEGLFDIARATKDAGEVALIREAARLTCEVISETIAFLQRHRVEDETLVTAGGAPLTIGNVKREIMRLLAERRLEDPHGVIFAIGRDGAIPHSKGNPDAPIRLGQPIVYDLYPRHPSGYFFDCTRTFCLGYAPPEVEKIYQDVSGCVDAVIAASQVGVLARTLQQVACQFFEERGHPTIVSDPQTEEGYVHSISHGLGLAVHEEPHFSDIPSNTTTLQPGHVYTIEPGLYYPDRGYGVRIEDVVWFDEQGVLHNLTELPRRLVVAVDGDR